MHFNPNGFAKINKGLRSCLPVFFSDMHPDVVRFGKSTDLGGLLKHIRPRRIKPHTIFALRGGSNHRGKEKHPPGKWRKFKLCMKKQIAPEGVCYDPRLRLPEQLDQVLLDSINLLAKA